MNFKIDPKLIFTIAMKLPGLIAGAVAIQQQISGKSGKDKYDAVVGQLDEMVQLGEFAAGKDFLKDPVIAGLQSVYIDAEAAALKAKEALRDGILTHSAAK